MQTPGWPDKSCAPEEAEKQPIRCPTQTVNKSTSNPASKSAPTGPSHNFRQTLEKIESDEDLSDENNSKPRDKRVETTGPKRLSFLVRESLRERQQRMNKLRRKSDYEQFEQPNKKRSAVWFVFSFSFFLSSQIWHKFIVFNFELFIYLNQLEIVQIFTFRNMS